MTPRSRSFLGLGAEGFHCIRYWEWGPEDAGRTVVCVHGLTRNGRDFDDLARALAGRGWRVAAPDVVGRGDSDWLVGKAGYDFAQYVADMTLLIARLGGQPVSWVGTSMGGIIGQMIAAGRDAPIRAMVLNDIGPFLDKAGLARIKGYVGNDPSYATFEEAKAAIDDVTDKFGPMDADQRRRFVELSVRTRTNGAITMNYDPKIAWTIKEAEPADIDLWPMWSAIRCPVLVMRGAESDLLSAATAKRMRAEGPKAEEYVVDGVGHAPALMSEAEIARIAEFLEARS